jgi:hypothetical protein
MKKTKIAGLIGMMTTLTGAFAVNRRDAVTLPERLVSRRITREEDRNREREEARRRGQVARGVLRRENGLRA